MHRMIERGGAAAAKTAMAAGVIDNLCNALRHHEDDLPLQGAVASVFRQLVAKGGESAARSCEAAEAIDLLQLIESRRDQNIQYQATKAIEAIQKALPKDAPLDEAPSASTYFVEAE